MVSVRGLITVVCLAAILAAALTPTAFDWLAVLVTPILLLTAVMPVVAIRSAIQRCLAQPHSLLSAAAGRAPPIF
jgi:predicted Co/Zn/Cd cation transporter (cation efflux family)